MYEEEKLIVEGLELDYKKAIFNRDKKLMNFVKTSFESIRSFGDVFLQERIEKNIRSCDFFLQTFIWDWEQRREIGMMHEGN